LCTSAIATAFGSANQQKERNFALAMKRLAEQVGNRRFGTLDTGTLLLVVKTGLEKDSSK